MPSSPDYKRDYKQERATAKQRGEMDDHAARLRARRAMEKDGKVKPHDDKDVDHKKRLATGGSNDKSNLRVQPVSVNRSRNGHKKGE